MIISCFSVVNSVYVITKYSMLINSDAHFKPKTKLVNILWIHGTQYYECFQQTTMQYIGIAKSRVYISLNMVIHDLY